MKSALCSGFGAPFPSNQPPWSLMSRIVNEVSEVVNQRECVECWALDPVCLAS